MRNEVNTRYHVVEAAADNVDIHLFDLIDEMKADRRNRVKVKVFGKAADTIDKQRILDAGANKVEVITEDAQLIEAPEAGVLEKFDTRKIRESYEDFCSKRSIKDMSLGFNYLSKIDAPCGI